MMSPSMTASIAIENRPIAKKAVDLSHESRSQAAEIPERGRPAVRLERTIRGHETEQTAAAVPNPISKLAFRLNEVVNEALRSLIRCFGDSTAIVDEVV
jgi:hypothetical protein